MFVHLLFVISTEVAGSRRLSRHRVAIDEGISTGIRWAGADCNMVPHLALGTNTTLVAAGVGTPVARVANLGSSTVAIVLAFSSSACHQGITDVASRAGADWTVFPGSVVAWIALSVYAARVRGAEVLFFERSALHKWISGHVFRARAHSSCSIPDAAVGVDTTDASARIYTLVELANLSRRRTVSTADTLSAAGHVGVT